jgi:hypothetical protein
MENNKDENNLEDNTEKDFPWYFLIFSFLVGIPAGIINTGNYLSEHSITISNIPIKALPQIIAYIIGGSIVPFLISFVVIGFIWLISFGNYKKPIKHIFFMSIVLSILALITTSYH